jgi:hypothetical protein
MAQRPVVYTLGWITLAVAAYYGLKFVPDLVRYIKIERM